MGEVQAGLGFLEGVAMISVGSSDLCESGSCGCSNSSLVLLLMNTFWESSFPDLPSNFCLSLSNLFLLSVSESFDLSGLLDVILIGLGKDENAFAFSDDLLSSFSRSNGISFVSDSKGIAFVIGFQELELSGDVGELGVSISGDAGVIESSTCSSSCLKAFLFSSDDSFPNP